MFSLLYLFFTIGLGAAEVINLNNEVDFALGVISGMIHDGGFGITEMQGGSLGDKVYWQRGQQVGMDSLRRTSDVTASVIGKAADLEGSLGFGLLMAVFPNITVGSDSMTGYVRLRGNSFRILLHLGDVSTCDIVVEALEMKSLGRVEFGSSLPQYDGRNQAATEYMERYLVPAVNSFLNSQITNFQNVLIKFCKFRSNNYGHYSS